MTQEDRILLLKDLCARLPYGVKCYGYQFKIDDNDNMRIGTVDYITEEMVYLKDRISVNGGKTYQDRYFIEDTKPYLRPLSSMTEEELRSEFGVDMRDEDNGRHTEIYGYVIVYHNFNGESWYIPFKAFDWLNAHHFDYRGLIKKGLALPALEGMYNVK